jgi:hypothetical protein
MNRSEADLKLTVDMARQVAAAELFEAPVEL